MRALLVGPGRLHVAESLDDRAWRVYALHLDLGDLDAGAIVIEDLLQESGAPRLDLGAALGTGKFEGSLADDLAHRRLGGVLHGLLGIADVEEILAGVLDQPEHHELDVDDVLVAGQHQAFRRTSRLLVPARRRLVPERKPTSARLTRVTSASRRCRSGPGKL